MKAFLSISVSKKDLRNRTIIKIKDIGSILYNNNDYEYSGCKIVRTMSLSLSDVEGRVFLIYYKVQLFM